jgi:hypothetical protein
MAAAAEMMGANIMNGMSFGRSRAADQVCDDE